MSYLHLTWHFFKDQPLPKTLCQQRELRTNSHSLFFFAVYPDLICAISPRPQESSVHTIQYPPFWLICLLYDQTVLFHSKHNFKGISLIEMSWSAELDRWKLVSENEKGTWDNWGKGGLERPEGSEGEGGLGVNLLLPIPTTPKKPGYYQPNSSWLFSYLPQLRGWKSEALLAVLLKSYESCKVLLCSLEMKVIAVRIICGGQPSYSTSWYEIVNVSATPDSETGPRTGCLTQSWLIWGLSCPSGANSRQLVAPSGGLTFSLFLLRLKDFISPQNWEI